jgi:hypothetical protein
VERANIKINCNQIGCEGTEWIYLAQEMVQWVCFMTNYLKIFFHKRRLIS